MRLAALAQYARPERLPFFLIESAYENEYDATEQRLRAQAYEAMLCGAAGQVFGNNPIWHFGTPGARVAPVTWRQALDGRGSWSMAHLRRLFTQLPWWLLEPDLHGRLVTEFPGIGGDRPVAASASDGSWGLIYLSTQRPVTVDLGRLRGPRVEARWYDPATGRFPEMEDMPLRASGAMTFRSPETNGGGFADWVLVLQSHD